MATPYARVRLAILIVVSLTAPVVPAHASPITLATLDWSSASGTATVFDRWQLGFGLGFDIRDRTNCVGCDLLMRPGTLGSFTFDRSNSPYFSDVAAKLTDGQAQTLQTTFYNVVDPLTTAVGVGRAGSEASLLGLSGVPDLVGHTINLIQLDVLSSVLSQMDFKGSVIDVDTFHVRWTISGDDPAAPSPVPEPSSIVLATSGAFALAARLRTRRRRQVNAVHVR